MEGESESDLEDDFEFLAEPMRQRPSWILRVLTSVGDRGKRYSCQGCSQAHRGVGVS